MSETQMMESIRRQAESVRRQAAAKKRPAKKAAKTGAKTGTTAKRGAKKPSKVQRAAARKTAKSATRSRGVELPGIAELKAAFAKAFHERLVNLEITQAEASHRITTATKTPTPASQVSLVCTQANGLRGFSLERLILMCEGLGIDVSVELHRSSAIRGRTTLHAFTR